MSDKFDLMKLARNNQVIVIIMAIAVSISLAWGIFFLPRMKELRAKYLDCRSCESQVVDARNLIESVSKLDKEYGARILICEKEAASGLDEFTKHGKTLGINFLSVKPGNVIIPEGMPYKILPIEMEIEAAGEDFVKFAGSIDELKKAIVTMRSFDITPDKDDGKKLKVDMVVDMYLSLRDDRAE
ncbi:MAG: type 4a pilus biogenesis protein PilO [Candidatus Omnitrophota bacterium]|nr:type 4a pilus biogenesis protein PilO [Candidatus Omnitrophota bacterium]